jgi:AraC family transcriptional regulator of adaptative response/methylated-DNA-[protein]-cysteine methyltransferase
MMTEFERITAAIHFINGNFQEQPSLEQIAKAAYLSPYHFQRLFTEWAGVSPKKFLQYISLQHAKKLLQQKISLADTTFETGLSATSRLHDLFIRIEGMTPGEFKNGGENLMINYSFAESPFGDIVIASTGKGICHIAFADEKQKAFSELKNNYPKATFQSLVDSMQQNALRIFQDDWRNIAQIRLHLKGSPFQLKVWETLLKIPFGQVSSYSGVATALHNPNAQRAVGSAVGDNPVAYLIPCHRVIKSSGIIGDYHCGSDRKAAIVGWEAAKTFGEN